MRAAMRPSAQAAANASKLEPFPLANTAIVFIALSDFHARTIRRPADHRSFLALFLQNGNHFGSLILRNRDHHTDTHVEDIEHLAVSDLAVFLQQAEHGQDLPRPS